MFSGSVLSFVTGIGFGAAVFMLGVAVAFARSWGLPKATVKKRPGIESSGDPSIPLELATLDDIFEELKKRGNVALFLQVDGAMTMTGNIPLGTLNAVVYAAQSACGDFE